MTISPVIEARRPTLPWIAGADRPFQPLSSTKPRIAAVVLGPDDEDVGDRRVGDPHLGTGKR
jgi:hypothetical protein